MTPPPRSHSGFEYGADGPRAVLIGVDGTESSLRAVDYALGQARRTRATAVGVYVRPLNLPYWTARSGAPQVMQETYDACLLEATTYLADRAHDCGVTHTFWERYGDPARELALVADELRADLIVLGTPESLGHRVTGSVPARLVRMARWPVLTVP